MAILFNTEINIMQTKPKLLTPQQTPVIDNDWMIEACKQQIHTFWTEDEFNLEKDIQDIRVKLTEAERHGVLTTLKLFSLYEMVIGNEYWSTVVAKNMPRTDVTRMATCFAHVELNSHLPFYNE